MRRHRRTWLITRWSSKARRARQDDADAARQLAEQRAARARILTMATTMLPTVAPRRNTPLLTPGQAARAPQGRRR